MDESPVAPPLVAAPVELAPFAELTAALLVLPPELVPPVPPVPIAPPLAAEVAGLELPVDPEPPEQAAHDRPRPDRTMAREIKRCTVVNAAG